MSKKVTLSVSTKSAAPSMVVARVSKSNVRGCVAVRASQIPPPEEKSGLAKVWNMTDPDLTQLRCGLPTPCLIGVTHSLLG